MYELTRSEVATILRALEYAEDELASAESDGWVLSTGVLEEIEDAKEILSATIEHKDNQIVEEL